MMPPPSPRVRVNKRTSPPPRQWETRFITAASDGDLNAVKNYLKDGLDVNSQDWDKLTALVAAASQGHLKVVKHLLDKVSQ